MAFLFFSPSQLPVRSSICSRMITGVGGYFNGLWFSSPWLFDIKDFHIGDLEMFGVFLCYQNAGFVASGPTDCRIH